MEVLNYSEARANFAHMLDKVNEDHAPILITRQGGKPAVLISLDVPDVDHAVAVRRDARGRGKSHWNPC